MDHDEADLYDCQPAYFLTQPEESWPGYEYTRVYDEPIIEWGVWRADLPEDFGGEG